MEKLKMHTPDLTEANIQRIRELFPSCITETKDATGNVKLAVDFDQLRQELSDSIVEGPQERYHLNWPGKREALLTANAPIAKTLRPSREESVEFDTTKNLFIEGDNLDALKLLQETYLGKVSIIYIDPPYNTGNDFVYEDDFSQDSEEFFLRSNQKDSVGNRLVANTESNGRFHSDWLSMMYSRLRVASRMLAEDGVILISIDDNEQSNLKKICDEIFGEDNFLASLVWKKKYTGGKHSKSYAGMHEYILVYCKSSANLDSITLDRPDDEKEKFSEQDEHVQTRGKFYVRPLKSNLGLRKTLIYPIEAPDGTILETQWLVAKPTFEKLLSEKRVEFRKKRDGNYQIYRKYYEKDGDGTVKPPSLIEKFPNTEGKSDLKSLFNIKEGRDNVFYTVKPLSLIKYLLAPYDNQDALVMDFFAGSGTTAHAVLEMNLDGGHRKFITVQLPEPISDTKEYATVAEITKDRIRKAINKIKEENPSFHGDLGFRVLKIDTSNMAEVYYTPDGVKQDDLLAAVDNIKPDRKPEDLLFQVLLDWGVDLSLPITKQTIQGKIVFFVDGNALVACFDNGITEELVKELAGGNPLRVVFRDNGFVSDSVKINAEQIFKQMSPGTDVKSI